MSTLSKRFIDDLEPPGKDRLIPDDRLTGFYLRVKPTGVKSFVVRYRTEAGQQRSYTLGKYGELTPKQARDLAAKKLGEVRHGHDPSAERQQVRHASTVAELATVYEDEHLQLKKSSTRERVEGLLRRVILPALGQQKCETLTRADVLRMHRALSDKPVEANRAVTLLHGLLAWGEEREHIRLPDGNPCARVRKYPERPRRRYLRPKELKRLGQALTELEEEGQFHPSSLRVIRLALLTGCRIGEMQRLRWRAVDLEGARLMLGETKTGPRIVHLSRAAVRVLQEAREATDHDLVCPGRTGKPISYPKRVWEELKSRAGLADVTPHDLRRTYASIARSQGESLEVAMELLGHSTAGMGDRYAFLWDEKARSATERIGAALEELTEPSGAGDPA